MLMTPAEAGFDGAKGYRVPAMGPGFRSVLKRGKTKPSDHPSIGFREELVWLYPDGVPPRLLWCNANDQWFELSFTPIEKP